MKNFEEWKQDKITMDFDFIMRQHGFSFKEYDCEDYRYIVYEKFHLANHRYYQITIGATQDVIVQAEGKINGSYYSNPHLRIIINQYDLVLHERKLNEKILWKQTHKMDDDNDRKLFFMILDKFFPKKATCLNHQTAGNLREYLSIFPDDAAVVIKASVGKKIESELDCVIACNMENQLEQNKVLLFSQRKL